MILKLLENGGFRLIDYVVDCRFSRAPVPHVTYIQKAPAPAGVTVTCTEEQRVKVELYGDVFVLNEHGDSTDRFRIDPRKEGRQ